MSNPDFPRPQWDHSAVNLPPIPAARRRLAAAQEAQKFGYLVMTGATGYGHITREAGARMQREAPARMAEARDALARLARSPQCAQCEGRGFRFLSLDPNALPVWCGVCT